MGVVNEPMTDIYEQRRVIRREVQADYQPGGRHMSNNRDEAGGGSLIRAVANQWRKQNFSIDLTFRFVPNRKE